MSAKKTTPPVIKRPDKFSLKDSTCAQLVAWLETSPHPHEHDSDVRLRGHYKSKQNLAHLKLCHNLPASYHRAWTRTAAALKHVPHIRLTCTGGRPKAGSMPPFTASLKRIAAMNGFVIHKMDGGAFIQDRTPKDPKTLHHPEFAEPMADGELFTPEA